MSEEKKDVTGGESFLNDHEELLKKVIQKKDADSETAEEPVAPEEVEAVEETSIPEPAGETEKTEEKPEEDTSPLIEQLSLLETITSRRQEEAEEKKEEKESPISVSDLSFDDLPLPSARPKSSEKEIAETEKKEEAIPEPPMAEAKPASEPAPSAAARSEKKPAPQELPKRVASGKKKTVSSRPVVPSAAQPMTAAASHGSGGKKKKKKKQRKKLSQAERQARLAARARERQQREQEQRERQRREEEQARQAAAASADAVEHGVHHHAQRNEEEERRHREVLARHQLEQQEVTEVVSFLRRNLKYLVAGAVVILVVGMGFAFATHRRSRAAVEADNELFNASDVDQIEAVVKKYPDTPAGPIAVLALARERFNAGKVDEARALYEKFLKDYSDPEMLLQAKYGLIACREAKGDLEGAANEYGKLAEENAESYLAGAARLSQARCLKELGRYEQARTVYEDLVADTPDSPWASRAKLLLKEVRAHLEE